MENALVRLIEDKDLTPESTLVELLAANGIENAGKLSRKDKEALVKEILRNIDYTRYLPQSVALTAKFMSDVLDPVMTATIPTGEYRLTMRKLLRLSYGQLQQQASLMKLDVEDLDEIGMAKAIISNYDKTSTDLTPDLARLLLSKEMAFVYGIIIQIPPSFYELNLKPYDIEKSSLVTRDDILSECMNQGVGVNRKESKEQLSLRLIVYWSRNPSQVRQPFTRKFGEFLTHLWQQRAS